MTNFEEPYVKELLINRVERLPSEQLDAFWEQATEMVTEFKQEEAADISNSSLDTVIDYLGESTVLDILESVRDTFS